MKDKYYKCNRISATLFAALLILAFYYRGTNPHSIYLHIMEYTNTTKAKHYVELGKSYYNMGDMENAGKYAKMAIEHDLSNSMAHNNYGHYLMKEGKIMEAEKELNAAIDLNDKNLSAYINLGALKTKVKKYNEATTYLKKAIELDENNITAHYNLGVVYFHINNYFDSLLQFRKTEQLNPFHNESRAWMALIFKKNPHLRRSFTPPHSRIT